MASISNRLTQGEVNIYSSIKGIIIFLSNIYFSKFIYNHEKIKDNFKIADAKGKVTGQANFLSGKQYFLTGKLNLLSFINLIQ